MQDLSSIEDRSQVEIVKIIVEQISDSLHIRGLELTDTWCFGSLGQFVKFQMSLHGHIAGEMGELDLNQLLRVDGAVPVPACSHWLG